MKKSVILFKLFVLIAFWANAQDDKSKNLGKSKSFASVFRESSNGFLNSQKRKSLMVGNGSNKDFSLKLNYAESKDLSNKLIGEVEGEENSTYTFDIAGDNVTGLVILPKKKEAYKYESINGNLHVKPVDIHKILCVDYENKDPKSSLRTAGTNATAAVPPAGDPVYTLESLPGAGAVVKLDFDGEYVTGTSWAGGATIDAQPGSFTAAQIQEIWNMVSEDYRPFALNITTSEAVYNAAPSNRRIKCIFTPTTTAQPGAGGVAYLGSFTYADNYKPCWVFNSSTKSAGEAASHEIGHTMGLFHDGKSIPRTEYYQGTSAWAPIMGVGYYTSLVQFSKGEYYNPSNTQDDFTIITTSNGYGYRTDEDLNTIASARNMTINSGNVAAASNNGLIHNNTDVDYFKFTVSSLSTINLTVAPSATHPDLNIKAQILNSSGTVLFTSDVVGNLAAPILYSIPVGTYYLAIDGVGEGDVASTGFSDYGSVGSYFVSGTITNCGSTFEPNETSATASSFTLNTTLNSNITTTTDVDFFVLNVTNPWDINLTLSGLTGDLDIQLLNAAGTVLASSTKSGNATEDIAYLAPSTGLYYVKVFLKSGATLPTTCYTLTNSLVNNACATANEPNETTATATTFATNSSTQGAITSTTEVDYYKITLNAGNTIKVALTNLFVDIDIRLISTDGTTVLASSTNGSNNNENITYTITANGVYYLKVYGYNTANFRRCYTLSNTITSQCAINFEPNESIPTATTWAINNSVQGAISTSTDLDFFKLTLTELGVLKLDLSNLTLDCDLLVLDLAGNTLASSAIAGNTSESITLNVEAIGTYLVLVRPKYMGDYNNNCYTLSNTYSKYPSANALLFNTNLVGMIPANSKMSFPTGNCTFEMIMRVDPFPAPQYPGTMEAILENSNSAGNGYCDFWINRSNPGQPDNLTFRTGRGTVGTSRDLKDGICHHYAMVTDANFTYMYIDGVLVDQQANYNFAPLGNTDQPWTVGNVNSSYQQYNDFMQGLHGIIKEFRVWNVAKTPAEIQANMKYKMMGTESGLVGYWPMDEGTGQVITDKCASPVSGYLGNAQATTTFDPTWSTSCARLGLGDPVSNKALTFNGTNKYVTIPAKASAAFTLSQNFTYEITFKQEGSLTAGSQEVLVNAPGFAITTNRNVSGTNDYVVFNLGNYVVVTLVDITPNVCHKISISSTGNLVKCYYDGFKFYEFTTSGSAAVGSATTAFNLGANTNGTSPLNGQLKEFRIWNIARTDADLKANANTTLFGNEAGLIGYWPMNEGTGQTIADRAASPVNGYLGSSATTTNNDPDWISGTCTILGSARLTNEQFSTYTYTTDSQLDAENITASPNPFEDEVTIHLPANTTNNIEVVNLFGVKILEKSNLTSSTYTFGKELPSGCYLVRLKTDSNNDKVIKVVKK